MRIRLTAQLTPAGLRKIHAVTAAIAVAGRRSLERRVAVMRARAAAAAPSAEQEAEMLSRGVPTDWVFSRTRNAGFLIGTPEGGRFVRTTEMSLRQAIATDAIVVHRRSPTQVAVGTGSPQAINAKTGFRWNTTRRGLQGPTFPFNHAWVQAVEDGGAVWVVVPRAGNRYLEPEPGVLTNRMVKTVQPHRMFATARMAERAVTVMQVEHDVVQAVRQVGRA